MHDDPKAPFPVYKDSIPETLALVVAALGLWLAVMGGGGAIFAATVWVLTSTSLA
jgi:hypothetical protein